MSVRSRSPWKGDNHITRQVNHAMKFIWQNRLKILIGALFFAVLAVYWRDYSEDVASMMTGQAEYEDARLCTKFGFVAGDEKHNSCMSDLRDLRARDEEMIAATSIP